jgi:hypothetical protein
MPIVADFRVANDALRHLSVGADAAFTFEAPETLCRDLHPQGLVLVKYHFEAASALKWELFLNGSLVLWAQGSGTSVHTTFEVFDAKLLHPGLNQVSVRVAGGIGRLGIADLVLHYHVYT